MWAVRNSEATVRARNWYIHHINQLRYVDVMALNAKKLSIAPNTLATALCRLLAHIMKKHRKENNNNASVAIPLECNQRRSIIRINRSEQAPD